MPAADIDAIRRACACIRNSERLCGCGTPNGHTPPCRAAVAAARDPRNVATRDTAFYRASSEVIGV